MSTRRYRTKPQREHRANPARVAEIGNLTNEVRIGATDWTMADLAQLVGLDYKTQRDELETAINNLIRKGRVVKRNGRIFPVATPQEVAEISNLIAEFLEGADDGNRGE